VSIHLLIFLKKIAPVLKAFRFPELIFTPYLRQQERDDSRLFFEAKMVSASKMFGKHCSKIDTFIVTAKYKEAILYIRPAYIDFFLRALKRDSRRP
jgi:hypothetical protein